MKLFRFFCFHQYAKGRLPESKIHLVIFQTYHNGLRGFIFLSSSNIAPVGGLSAKGLPQFSEQKLAKMKRFSRFFPCLLFVHEIKCFIEHLGLVSFF